MTRRSTFKKKIRQRMKKTGERYAAARLALLKKSAVPSVPKGAQLVRGYTATPGVHPDTARLASALEQAGVTDPATGAAFSESKLFGLSGGIGFMYFLFEYKGHPPMVTFNCRTWTTPWPVIGKVLEHAGIGHDLHETGGAKGAAKKLDSILESERAVHATVDFASLPWSGDDPMWRGQMGRQLNIVGRSGDEFVVDVGTLRTLSAADLATARSAVKKEKNRLLAFEGGAASTDPVDAVRAAIAHTAHTFRKAPFKNFAGNFGLKGLEKAAALIGGEKGPKAWRKVFDSGPKAFNALYRTFECSMMELTPPAGGRSFYAEFLEDAARLEGLAGLRKAADAARESAAEFEALSETAIVAGGKPLAEAVELTEQIDELRRTESSHDVGQRIAQLRAERSALAEGLDLDADARASVFEELGNGFARIQRIETRLVEMLEAI